MRIRFMNYVWKFSLNRWMNFGNIGFIWSWKTVQITGRMKDISGNSKNISHLLQILIFVSSPVIRILWLKFNYKRSELIFKLPWTVQISLRQPSLIENLITFYLPLKKYQELYVVKYGWTCPQTFSWILNRELIKRKSVYWIIRLIQR